MASMFIELSYELRKYIRGSDYEAQDDIRILLFEKQLLKEEKSRKKFNAIYGVDCFPNNRRFYLIAPELLKKEFRKNIKLDYWEDVLFAEISIEKGEEQSFCCNFFNKKIPVNKRNSFIRKINKLLSEFEYSLYLQRIEETMILDEFYDDRVWNSYYLNKNTYFDSKTGKKTIKKRGK